MGAEGDIRRGEGEPAGVSGRRTGGSWVGFQARALEALGGRLGSRKKSRSPGGEGAQVPSGKEGEGRKEAVGACPGELGG